MSPILLIALAGGLLGAVIGLAAAGILTARARARTSIETWKAARIYYTRRFEP